jgi:hypothetical protein
LDLKSRPAHETVIVDETVLRTSINYQSDGDDDHTVTQATLERIRPLLTASALSGQYLYWG